MQRLQALRRGIGTAEGEVAARRAALEEAGTRARALKAQAAQLAQAAEAACRSLVQLRQQEQTLRGQLRGPAPGAGRSARAGRARARHPGCGGAESEPGAAGGGPRDQPGRWPAQAGRGRGRPRPCGPPEAAPASPCGTPGLPVDGRARVPGAWSRTYRSRAVTFAGTAGARQTRSGIRVFPERVAASWPAERLLPAVGGLRPARALEQALRGIAARYGMRTADLVAMQLEYPKDTATIRAKRCDRCGGTAVDRDARREVPLLPARARAH